MGRNFPKFDVVETCPEDHHYANTKNAVPITSESHNKITQEWKLLECHLPDTIHVRVYESRIDVLRVAIAGAAGTPYHDGLFFFDVAFPSDYPNSPPRVHYSSFGLRLNPNLYADGYVCLSLLNTWEGRKSERWDPKQSTLLQVLLSLQALVLNERPYFNEPGYDSFKGNNMWEKKADAYNEDAFYLSCKTMSYLMKNPPKDFEGLVAEHFRERARGVLLGIGAYVNGWVKVGYYHYDTEGTDKSGIGINDQKIVHVSKKFRKAMVELYPEMVQGLNGCGASVGDLSVLKVDEFKTKRVGKAVNLVWGKFKRLLGFKGKKNKIGGN